MGDPVLRKGVLDKVRVTDGWGGWAGRIIERRPRRLPPAAVKFSINGELVCRKP
jgi:hypothetical protein